MSILSGVSVPTTLLNLLQNIGIFLKLIMMSSSALRISLAFGQPCGPETHLEFPEFSQQAFRKCPNI